MACQLMQSDCVLTFEVFMSLQWAVVAFAVSSSKYTVRRRTRYEFRNICEETCHDFVNLSACIIVPMTAEEHERDFRRETSIRTVKRA
jgi:hypothetical protein